MWIFVGASATWSAWMSVFTATNSTWWMPASIMRLSAFSPAPPTPTTRMTAMYAPESARGCAMERRRLGQALEPDVGAHSVLFGGRRLDRLRLGARLGLGLGSGSAPRALRLRLLWLPGLGEVGRVLDGLVEHQPLLLGRRRRLDLLLLGLLLGGLGRSEQLRERAFTHAGALARH